jgi:hypothetical protein
LEILGEEIMVPTIAEIKEVMLETWPIWAFIGGLLTLRFIVYMFVTVLNFLMEKSIARTLSKRDYTMRMK